ncbi:nucleoside diphosphate kinase homolog 5 isoform X1 [Mastacembelus armatus]|uniref:nucleoside diphosphate kinase homolog 5 isoform X1 n=1 Tax=Mastacembelus armatus TaxID=205130 RepID=UPI000E4608A2|nr:nucleoside diphosphate kinase homolog 5-like isoform X1 [Mastacembelus armatus]XP_026186945.1 nucleoside diphosphate kinase homolog 5-like isoform X1 [Mastacembelus armatus]
MARTSIPRIYVERTLAVIKPDAIDKAEEIEDIIVKSGFVILQRRKLQLSPEKCSEFYADQYGKLNFPSLIAFMSSGPIVALTLARNNAIAHWKSIIGPVNSTKAREIHPKCLRAKYGTSDLENAVHGSESFNAAEREIKFMFPNCKQCIQLHKLLWIFKCCIGQFPLFGQYAFSLQLQLGPFPQKKHTRNTCLDMSIQLCYVGSLISANTSLITPVFGLLNG